MFNLINDKHVAAGCAPYGRSSALGDVSLQYAKTLAGNNGKLQPNTVALLQGKGYDPSYWGEMDYFNPNGSTPQDALDFWLNNPTKDLFGNCDITQMEVSVWIIGNNWAASSIMGTPKGATPPAAGQPSDKPPFSHPDHRAVLTALCSPPSTTPGCIRRSTRPTGIQREPR